MSELENCTREELIKKLRYERMAKEYLCNEVINELGISRAISLFNEANKKLGIQTPLEKFIKEPMNEV